MAPNEKLWVGSRSESTSHPPDCCHHGCESLWTTGYKPASWQNLWLATHIQWKSEESLHERNLRVSKRKHKFSLYLCCLMKSTSCQVWDTHAFVAVASRTSEVVGRSPMCLNNLLSCWTRIPPTKKHPNKIGWNSVVNAACVQKWQVPLGQGTDSSAVMPKASWRLSSRQELVLISATISPSRKANVFWWLKMCQDIYTTPTLVQMIKSSIQPHVLSPAEIAAVHSSALPPSAPEKAFCQPWVRWTPSGRCPSVHLKPPTRSY